MRWAVPAPNDGSRFGVLHINHAVCWRGAERQTLWLAQALARAGHRSILAVHPSGELAERAREQGMDVRPWPAWVARSPLLVMAWMRWLVRRERVQIVHAHTAHAVALAVAGALGTPSRVVVTRRVLPHLRKNPGTRWKYRRPAAIIAVTEATARVLEESGIDRERIEVIPDGVDLTRHVEAARPDALRALGIPDGAPLVVMAAALDPAKDPLTFVRAVAAARRAIPNLQALLLGEGVLSREVQDEVRTLELESVLHLPGFRYDVDALLAAADVVALSSRQEALGTVLLDALALGKPVAATAAGGIPEVVLHGRTGLLVPVGDAEALGGAIARLIEDPELAAHMGAEARRRAALYSLDVVAERTQIVYARALRAGTPLPRR